MLNQLLQSSVSFGWSVRATAFLVLGLLVLANVLMSDNPSIKEETQKPSVVSILTDLPYMLANFG